MIVGCYTLHLYCDFGTPGPTVTTVTHGGTEEYKLNQPFEFTGKDAAAAFRESRKKGWRVYPAQGKAKCPACAKVAKD